MKANFAGFCDLCSHEIRQGEDILPRRGGYIHRRCAPGQDDE